MLSGDTSSFAKFVAQKNWVSIMRLAIYCREIKLSANEAFFMGDGANDALVVVLSDAGIVMIGWSRDPTIETADVVITDDKPSRMSTIIAIGKKNRTHCMAKRFLAFGAALHVPQTSSQFPLLSINIFSIVLYLIYGIGDSTHSVRTLLYRSTLLENRLEIKPIHRMGI